MIDDEALKNIEKLHEMKAAGIISEEDFETAKKDLLSGRRRAKPARAGTATPSAVNPEMNEHLSWMLLPFRRYADFEGRSGRREFWMFYLLIGAVGAALLFIAVADTDMYGEAGPFAPIAYLLLILWLLGIVVPLVAVQVRRFHDLGRSGWLALLNLIPYIGAFAVLVAMALPGTEGENDYGPDPRL